MTTDERRARLIDVIASKLNLPNVFMGGPSPGAKIRSADIYDAIRQSDEAAGMVLVPREATQEMRAAGWTEFTCPPQQEDRIARVWRAMLAAATESDNG